MIESLSAHEKSILSANGPMTSYLRSFIAGRSATPPSWLFEEKPIEWVLSSAWDIITAGLGVLSEEGREIVVSLEKKQSSKFGPQGAIPPNIIKELFSPLFEPSEFDDPLSLSSYHEHGKRFAMWMCGNRLPSLRRKSIKSVVDDGLSQQLYETNSGWPDFKRRKDKTTLAQAMKDASTELAYSFVSLPLVRSQNDKLRTVWFFPLAVNLKEAQFTQPLMDFLRTKSTSQIQRMVAPWSGFNKVKEVTTSMWDDDVAFIWGGDISKMDLHMRIGQLKLVFECIKWLFQRTEWDALEQSILFCAQIPLIISDEEKMTGNHGLGSGSGWTNLSETVLQLFIMYLAELKEGKTLEGQAIGDDTIRMVRKSVLDGRTQGEYVAEQIRFLEHLGMPANMDKQSMDLHSTHFLQRIFLKGWWSRDEPSVLGGIYPIMRSLNSQINPERYYNPKDWSSDMFCARFYMIMENCVDHPAFESYLRWSIQGQKDLIPFALKQNSALDKIHRTARLIPGYLDTYNREKLDSSLKSFTSIKLVRQWHQAPS